MAVTSCTVSNVTSPVSVPSNLLNVILLSSLLGSGCGTLGSSNLATILALTGQIPFTFTAPLPGTGLSSLSSLPITSALSPFGIPSSFATPFAGPCAAPFGSNNILSTLLLFSLLGQNNIFGNIFGTNLFGTGTCG